MTEARGFSLTFVTLASRPVNQGGKHEQYDVHQRRDNVKVLVSMGDAWRSGSNDRVARVHPTYKDTCSRLEVANNSAPVLKTNTARPVKTLVHLPATYPTWQDTSMKEPECTVWMQIMFDDLSEMGRVMIQQMWQARTRENKCETVKMCSKGVERRMKDLKAKREEGGKQHGVIEG